MLTRETSFVPGVLPSADLELEFNNIVNYINNRTLSNPLSANLDFGDLFTVSNLRTFWNILNVAEYSSLAAAEAALPSTGGVLLVPPNTTIDISSTVTISKDNTWIVGMGPSSILRRATGTFSATSNAMILFNGRAGCGIKDLQLDGQQASNSGSTGLSAVRVIGTSTNFKFMGNLVRRWGDAAEASTSPNDGILIGADEASVPSGYTIINNTFQNCRRSAVRVMNGRYGSIIGNVCTWDALSSASAGIHLETPSSGAGRLQYITVNDNVVAGIGATLPLQGLAFVAGTTTLIDAARCVLSNNTLSNISGSGIHVSEGMLLNIVGNNLDTTNQVGTTAIGGIYLLDSAYCQVQGNVLNVVGSNISSSNAIGIDVEATAGTVHGFITVEGNILRNIAGFGIIASVNAGMTSAALRVAGNTVSRYSQQVLGYGIFVRTNGTGILSDTQVANNRVTLDGTAGVGNVHGIQVASSGTGTFSRATILGNDCVGGNAGAGNPLTTGGIFTSLDSSHNQV